MPKERDSSERRPSLHAVAEELSSDGVRWLQGTTTRPVEWVWPNYLPSGKLTILEGDPGVGKSLVTVDVAARVSVGREMPDGSRALDARAVLLVTAEDDIEDTIVPRLEVAGADLALIGTLPVHRNGDGREIPLTIPNGLEQLETMILDSGAALVVVDPITCFLDASVNTNNDSSVRSALLPLAEVASRTSAAVVVVRHFNKDADKRAIYRGGGSIGFTAAARSVLALGEHPKRRDTFVLVSVKSNLVDRTDVPSLAYRLVPSLDDDRLPIVEWEQDPVDVTADEMHERPDARRRSPRLAAAKEFLLNEMTAGQWFSAGALKSDAADQGIHPRTLERAADHLSVQRRTQRGTDGRVSVWEWALEPAVDP